VDGNERAETLMDHRDTMQRLHEMEAIQSALEREHIEFQSELSTLIVQVVEAVPDAVVVVNGEGSIVLVNRQAELLFDYHRRDLISQSVEMLLPERLRQNHAAHRMA
jgi:PAS domain-containing protein